MINLIISKYVICNIGGLTGGERAWRKRSGTSGKRWRSNCRRKKSDDKKTEKEKKEKREKRSQKSPDNKEEREEWAASGGRFYS